MAEKPFDLFAIRCIPMVKEIKIKDFDYNLSAEKIPAHPLAVRDECRLLLSRPDGIVADRTFRELPALLPPSALLVGNDTRVINARMAFHKATGSRIEIFLLEPMSPSDYVLTFQAEQRCVWKCLVGNLKRWKEGSLSIFFMVGETPVTLNARRIGPLDGNAQEIEFSWDASGVSFASVVDAVGKIPIPPYLGRDTEDCDSDDYQTVYSIVKGSVAAPTAGLHFTTRVLEDLRAHNMDMEYVTLHVGAGTFQPVKSETIGGHPMHTETFSVKLPLVERLIKALRDGRPVAAVGTTTVRTLESLPYLGAAIGRGDLSLKVGQWWPYEEATSGFDTIEALESLRDWMRRGNLDTLTASTAIMIAPGFKWRVVGTVVTNFHQPQSTLLLLVSSFLNPEGGDCLQWRRIYSHALESGYRFLSYGDACLLFPVNIKCQE